MKLSNYEIMMPLDDSWYLLANGLYCAFDVVELWEGKALEEGRLDAIPAGERQRLLARGHLTETPEAELEDLKLMAGYYRKYRAESNLGLLILPTYDCNFRCPYCFERHRLCRGEEWLHKTMSKEMVDAIFQAVENEKARGVKAKSCQLYGGEPFLEKNSELVRYIVRKAADAGMTLSAVTNGYSLDCFLDLLEEYPFKSLQITLDGVKEDNDRRRVYIGGGGSFEKIMENTGLAVSKGIKTSIRINTGPSNLERVHLLKQVFEDRGLTAFPEFSYYYAPTKGETHVQTDSELTCREIVDTLIQNGFEEKEAMEHVSHYSVYMGGIRDLIKTQTYFSPSDSHCGAEKMMYLIDPEGAIYTCWDCVARENMRVGRVDTEKGKFAFNFSLLQWNFRNVLNMPKCMKCPYVFVCGGGCAAWAYKETGNISEPYCGEVEEIFRDSAVEVCREMFAESRERELTKSLKDQITKYRQEQGKQADRPSAGRAR